MLRLIELTRTGWNHCRRFRQSVVDTMYLHFIPAALLAGIIYHRLIRLMLPETSLVGGNGICSVRSLRIGLESRSATNLSVIASPSVPICPSRWSGGDTQL